MSARLALPRSSRQPQCAKPTQHRRGGPCTQSGPRVGRSHAGEGRAHTVPCLGDLTGFERFKAVAGAPAACAPPRVQPFRRYRAVQQLGILRGQDWLARGDRSDRPCSVTTLGQGGFERFKPRSGGRPAGARSSFASQRFLGVISFIDDAGTKGVEPFKPPVLAWNAGSTPDERSCVCSGAKRRSPRGRFAARIRRGQQPAVAHRA